MFCLRRPGPLAIGRFLEESLHLPLSYTPVGLARQTSTQYRFDEALTVLGNGPEAFRKACAALSTWRHFDLGWVQPSPATAPTTPGTVVAVLIRHLGFWSLNGCRVMYRTDDSRGLRVGFAYGTLLNHAEAGEELFEVTLDEHTGDVAYRIRAASWPHATLAHVGQPIVRVLQARFRRDSAEAMRRAVRTSETEDRRQETEFRR